MESKQVTLELMKKDDGHWLFFSDSKGRSAMINIELYFHNENITHPCIRQWAIDQFPEKEIDWSKVPVDTLIEITFDSGHKIKRYFKCYYKNINAISTFANGATSKTQEGRDSWDLDKYNCKVLEYPCTCKDKTTINVSK